MFKLKLEEHGKVLPIINTIDYNHIFAEMVVLNQAQGEIFVNCISHPTTCLIIHQYGMAFLCGDTTNKLFNDQLIQYLSRKNESKPKYLLIHPLTWESVLNNLLKENLMELKSPDNIEEKDNTFIKTRRVNFTFNRDSIIQEDIPNGFYLRKIDSDLFYQIQGSVVPQTFWKDDEAFHKHSIGFTLLHGSQVVSTCFVSYKTDQILELGIETSLDYRQKGYSLIPANALLCYCLEHHYTPLWSCRKENSASYKTAIKLGFIPLSEHPYYLIPNRVGENK